MLRTANIVAFAILALGMLLLFTRPLFIVTEFVPGMNLANSLNEQRPTPREAANLCVEIADALEHAHQHGVVHRDLKPSNIMCPPCALCW